MDGLQTILTVLLVGIITAAIRKGARRNVAADEQGAYLLRQSRVIFWIGAGSVLFGFLLAGVCAYDGLVNGNETAGWPAILIFLGLSALGFLLLLAYWNQRVWVCPDRVRSRDLFGRVRELRYDEIERVRMRMGTLILTGKGRKVECDPGVAGSKYLMARLVTSGAAMEKVPPALIQMGWAQAQAEQHTG